MLVLPCGGSIFFCPRTNSLELAFLFKGEILVMKKTPGGTWKDET